MNSIHISIVYSIVIDENANDSICICLGSLRSMTTNWIDSDCCPAAQGAKASAVIVAGIFTDDYDE
jgi:hypothetical protein